NRTGRSASGRYRSAGRERSRNLSGDRNGEAAVRRSRSSARDTAQNGILEIRAATVSERLNTATMRLTLQEIGNVLNAACGTGPDVLVSGYSIDSRTV